MYKRKTLTNEEVASLFKKGGTKIKVENCMELPELDEIFYI